MGGVVLYAMVAFSPVDHLPSFRVIVDKRAENFAVQGA
jgi:hypothetical protein